MLRYYKRAFNSKKWKRGFIRTVRGTNDHVVRPQLKLLNMPTLFISGEMDRIVDPLEGARAASELPQGRFEEIPACGHAPQIEKSGYINRLVVQFLTTTRPLDTPKLKQLYLQKPTRGTP
jgi:pimeloyl-ACP methyl ester carboxylesterase